MLCIYRGKMPQLSTEKMKAKIFDGSQIKQLIKYSALIGGWANSLNFICCSCRTFSGQTQSWELFWTDKQEGCSLSIKVHNLHSHLDCFSENLVERGTRWKISQGILDYERPLPGMIPVLHMTAGYCCSLKKNCFKLHSRMYFPLYFYLIIIL